MQLINWLELQPLLADVDTLNARLQEAQPLRSVCRFLVDITLHGYPWSSRSDLIPCYHPSRTYHPGQWIALPVTDKKMARPTAWQVARVEAVEPTGNSVQGRFQALVLDVGGKEVQRTAGLPGADFPEPGLSDCTSEELGWLGDWVVDRYAGALSGTLKKLIHKGRVCGQLAGDTFLPEQMFALSVDRLEPFFARLSPALRWVSLEQILQGLPDLAHLKRETALTLLRSTLRVSPYRSLGGDRWTTPDLFEQLDRQVPCGLPGIRTQVPLWTGQDRKDLAVYRRKPIPAEAVRALEELGIQAARPEPDSSAWEPPNEPCRLPALSTLTHTQVCLPVGRTLHAFAPEARMLFLQLMDGEHLPFLLDREHGLLKAVHVQALQACLLEENLPAGTHLWIEHQGGEAYRIAPRPLAAPHRVPCKRASLEGGKLLIEYSQIQIKYESEESVFQVDLLLEDLQALAAEAQKSRLSVREALVSAVRDLTAADPRRGAMRADIFNSVFLKRSCSPHAVAALLYSLPCFESLKGGGIRYRPMSASPVVNVWKQTNRVTQLWEDLAEHCVAPDPAAGKRLSLSAALAPEPFISPELVPQTAPLSTAGAGELPRVTVLPVSLPAGIEQEQETSLIERVSRESLHLIKHALVTLTAPPEPAQDGEEPQEILPVSPVEREEMTIEPLPVQAGFLHYPAMVRVTLEPDPQPGSAIDTRRIAYGLKVPARPLHKRPIYQRVFFCVRGWFHLVSRRRYDLSP